MKLAKRVMELHVSTTFVVTARAAKMKADGVDVVSFAAGEPDFDMPAHIIRAAAEDRLIELLTEAARKRTIRRPTKPTVGSRARRLEEKRQRSVTKRERRAGREE